MMAGFLLARAGIQVVLLEKHNNFLRDFRGDTIHPSTYELMHELGLLDDFLKLPHQEMEQLGAQFNDEFFMMADFTHLSVAKPALGFMPQWDFLNFLESKAKAYPSFKLLMNAKVTDLLWENNRVRGVVASTPDGIVHVHSAIVIGADGRHSVVREKARLQVISSGAPIDVLWFRLQMQEEAVSPALGRFYHGKILILIYRGDYYQCGYVIAKGEYEKIKAKGLEAFKNELKQIIPSLEPSINNLQAWEDVSILSVEVDHLKQWYAEGVLCIGDAAHAMSPVGGVGINLAIQDAVATANILYPALHANKQISTSLMKKVQQRRALPARLIQRMQIVVHNTFIVPTITLTRAQPPLFIRLSNKVPVLRRLPAWLIGMGIRREHIQTPDVKAGI